MLAQGITTGFMNWTGMSDMMGEMMLAFSAIFVAAALVMAAVGAVGLLATLSMAVFERQKEIGVMRSIGASSATIAGQFLVEGMLVGVLPDFWPVGMADMADMADGGINMIQPHGIK